MSNMARAKADKTIAVKKAIADILFNHKSEITFIGGKPSPLSIVKLLKEKYGCVSTRQTVWKYLKEDMSKYQKMIPMSENEKIKNIREAMGVQKSIWNGVEYKPLERTKASSAWRQLQKQLIDYEQQLTDNELKKADVTRPNYLIKIVAPSIMVTCPKCGHEWANLRKEDKKDEKD